MPLRQLQSRKMVSPKSISSLFFLAFTLFHFPLVISEAQSSVPLGSSSPFSIALQTLQTHLNYSFQNVALLGRAMTHASFSEENNRAFSILGSSVIEASMALQWVNKNLDISSKDLNRRIAEVLKVEGSCTADGLRFQLEKVVRVSSKTNSSTPTVVCGAFRAIFGAVALDSGSLEKAGVVYLGTQGVGIGVGKALSM